MCLAWCLQAQSSLLFEVTTTFKAQSSKDGIYCVKHGTSSVELAFRSHCDFEGSVEQSIVFTVFSKAQSSWLCV